jgi:hypothetical protein
MIISNRFTRWLSQHLARRAERVTRPPDFIIGDRADPYMLRWWILPRNPVFNVYLHKFLRDDEDRANHDHPWQSVSISLTESMIEHYVACPRGMEPFQATRFVFPGDVVFRSAKFAHRMVVPTRGAMTIFITGPRVRTWGFLCGKDTAAGGWRPWYDFVGRDKGQIGRGCD